MVKYNKYIWYVLRHKFYVFQECLKMRLVWQGIIHDFSKFFPDEFFPYAKFFYGDHPPVTASTGYYHKPDVDKEFDIAWQKHLHRGKHHWQHYILHEDCGQVKVLEMPLKYRKEMLADWIGASAAQGKGKLLTSVRSWYIDNRSKMTLGEETQKWIEGKLGV